MQYDLWAWGRYSLFLGRLLTLSCLICLCGEYSRVINWSTAICALPGVPPAAETDGRTSHHFLCGHPSALSTRIHRSRMETMNLWRIVDNLSIHRQCRRDNFPSVFSYSFVSFPHTEKYTWSIDANAWLTHWKGQLTSIAVVIFTFKFLCFMMCYCSDS